jgi:hypothetical protein
MVGPKISTDQTLTLVFYAKPWFFTLKTQPGRLLTVCVAEAGNVLLEAAGRVGELHVRGELRVAGRDARLQDLGQQPAASAAVRDHPRVGQLWRAAVPEPRVPKVHKRAADVGHRTRHRVAVGCSARV